MARQQPQGPQFVKFFPVVLQALRELGGSARPAEVRDKVASLAAINDAAQSDQLPSGAPRFNNRVAWARFYLAKAGLIDQSQRGVWTLTDLGRETKLTQQQAITLFQEIHSKFAQEEDEGSGGGTGGDDELAPESDKQVVTDHRKAVLEILQALPPEGFERFSQRLLRESGFEEVTVTGKSGDGGIDGIGVLQINPLVSFKVLFQCKRYKGLVTPSQVRDFRGAMQGRADKGIILTTGSFTADAKKEAMRDGVPPIELVDAEKLIDMMEKLEFGLAPVQAYRVTDQFFDEYRGR